MPEPESSLSLPPSDSDVVASLSDFFKGWPRLLVRALAAAVALALPAVVLIEAPADELAGAPDPAEQANGEQL